MLLLLLLLLPQTLETDGYIAKKMERRLDKAIKFVIVSGKKALADAGLDWQGQDIKVRCGCALQLSLLVSSQALSLLVSSQASVCMRCLPLGWTGWGRATRCACLRRTNFLIWERWLHVGRLPAWMACTTQIGCRFAHGI
jgi:hypothetical protein